MSTDGRSPVTVIEDNTHFRTVINARLKSVSLVDPLGLWIL